jgi:hypothetical protein
MVQASCIRRVQIGPRKWVSVLRDWRIVCGNAAASADDLAAARQVSWWVSNANPLRGGAVVALGGGVEVRGWLAASTDGRWWLTVEAKRHGAVIPGLSVIPRDADPAAFVGALLSIGGAL